jgi:hypothetical protein
VIYLDTNAWSDLTERATDAARRAYDAAGALHNAGVTVFPLAYATITELLKREVNEDSTSQAEVMDVLSRGVCLRGDPHVRDLEVMCAYQFMTQGISVVPIPEMFTVLACYISDREIPAVGIPGDGGLLQLAYPTLRWLHSAMRTPQLLANEARTDEKYVRLITEKIADAPNWATDGSGKLNAKKLRFEEHTAAFKNYVMANLSRLVGLEGLSLIREKSDLYVKKSGGPGAVATVIGAMPSIALSCEMHVQKLLAGANTRKQDFYDHEHAARAIPYVDVFVTADGGLLDLIRKSKSAIRSDCTILNGMAALADYLEKLPR